MKNKTLLVFSICLYIKYVTCAALNDNEENDRVYRSSAGSKAPWCYMSDSCKQTSRSSGWQQGVCDRGTRQSPIDIKTSSLSKNYERPSTALNFRQYYSNYAMKQFYMTNNGHSIVLSKFITQTGNDPTFMWPLRENGVYKLEQVHFHWGPDDKSGSEHKLDGKAFPVEMHLVHYRSSQGVHGFPNFVAALSSGRADAIAVIGVFLTPENGNLTQSFLQTVVYNLESIPEKDDTTVVICVDMQLNFGDILRSATEAYHYMGSLTTPGCNEVVAWLVLKNPVKITKNDLAALRGAIKEEDGKQLTANFR